jgi:hypothetical protein
MTNVSLNPLDDPIKQVLCEANAKLPATVLRMKRRIVKPFGIRASEAAA